MTNEDRIQAVERLGFTRRQAAFLTMVMGHSGVCLPRQFATFAGVAYGHKVNRFFERLVSREFASVCPCLHNRALVYHVHHRPLYGAIGQPQSRLRRPVPAASVMPRLMLLDAVLEAPDVTWLAGEHDKVEHFTTDGGIPCERLPQQAVRSGGAPSSRLFPDALPIGVEAPGRALFVYPATRSSLVDFRPFLRRHQPSSQYSACGRSASFSLRTRGPQRLAGRLSLTARSDRFSAPLTAPNAASNGTHSATATAISLPWLLHWLGRGSGLSRGNEGGNRPQHALNPPG